MGTTIWARCDDGLQGNLVNGESGNVCGWDKVTTWYWKL